MRLSKRKDRLRKRLFVKKLEKSRARVVAAGNAMLKFTATSHDRIQSAESAAAILREAEKERDARPLIAIDQEPAVVIPVTECWLHEPAMKERLARAANWRRQNPPQESSLDELETKVIDGE